MDLRLLDRDWAEVRPTLQREYRLVEVTPNADQALRFATFVPQRWLAVTRAGSFVEGLGIATPIACFCESTSPQSAALVVTQTPVGFEVPLPDWLRLAIRGAGWELVDQRWVDTIGGRRFEVLARRRTDGYWWIRRTTAWVEAGRLLRIEAAATEGEWPRVDALLWPSARAFEPAVDPPRPELERRQRVVHPAEPRLSVDMAASWIADPAEGSEPGRAALDLVLPQGETWAGQVQVRFDAGPTRDDVAAPEARAMRVLRNAGLIPARRSSTDPFVPQQRADDWKGGFVREVDIDGRLHVARTGYLATEDGMISLLALAPRVGERPLDALRCRRAFEIAAQTACPRPTPDGIG